MILKNGTVLQGTDRGLSFQPLDLRIRNHKIMEITPHLLPDPGEECVDLQGDYVLPGMVNSHSHSYTNLLRGSSYGEPLELWSPGAVALGGILTEEEMSLATALGICEMLRAGVTSCVDHLPHLNTAGAAARTYLKAGFRAALAPMLHNLRDRDILYGMEQVRPPSGQIRPFPSPGEYMDFYKDFIKNYHLPSRMLQVMTGINSPQRADDSLLAAAADLTEKYRLNVHCHLLETRWQRLTAVKTGISPLKRLDAFSLLKENTSLAHCVWLHERELDLLAERKAVAVSNPAGNCFLGSGIFPFRKFQERGIVIALGSDGVNCGANHNMLEILRFFLLQQRTCGPDYTRFIQAKNALDMVTVNGGLVLGFTGSCLGKIQTGSAADICIVDKNCFLPMGDESLTAQLLFHNHLTARHVLINGNFVMRDYTLTTVDEEALREELSERLGDLKHRFAAALPGISQERQSFCNVYERLFLSK